MPSPRQEPAVAFPPAPAGGLVRFMTTLSLLIAVLAPGAAAVAVLLEPSRPPWPVFVAFGTLPVVVVLIWMTAHIRGFRIEGAELLVELPLRTTRFSLSGLESVVADREALRGARRVAGNGGLGAITGRYRSRRLGPFRAFVTDSEHAVVLRWSGRCLVISPEQHSFFVDTVRRRAGLTR